MLTPIKKLGIVTGIVFSLLVMSIYTLPLIAVQAQATPSKYTLLEPLPCINDGSKNSSGATDTCKTGTQMQEIDFETYVQYAFNLIIAAAAVLAVLMIVWGGFQYMSTDSFNDKKEGLSKLKNALSGLVLILCSYLILKTVDPRLVAIPVTLVEPIEIKCASNPDISVFDKRCVSAGSNFFDDLLASNAAMDSALNRQVIQERDAAKQVVSALESRIHDIETQLVAARQSNNNAEIQRLEREVANLQNQKNEAQTTAILKAAESGILASSAINVQKEDSLPNNTNTIETIREANNLATKAYDLALAELAKNGNPADKVNQLNNQYWPRHGLLVLQQNSLPESGTLDYRINNINRMLSISLPKITDPVKKNELEKSANTVLTELNRLKNAPADYYVPIN